MKILNLVATSFLIFGLGACGNSASGESSGAGYKTCENKSGNGLCVESDATSFVCNGGTLSSGRKCTSSGRTGVCAVHGSENSSYFHYYSNYSGNAETTCGFQNGTWTAN